MPKSKPGKSVIKAMRKASGGTKKKTIIKKKPRTQHV